MRSMSFWMSRRAASLFLLAGVAGTAAGCGGPELPDDEVLDRQGALGAPSLPGRIQAEDYLGGGEGVGYHDTTAGNSGGKHRSDDVDIGSAAAGGHYVGWVTAGEWLAYDVDVASAGRYAITVRMASAFADPKPVRVELDGETIATLTLTGGNGWESWKDVTASNLFLPAGPHELKLVLDAGKLNVDRIDVQRDCGVSSKLVPGCGAWIGAAADPKSGETYGEALDRVEAQTGRDLDIVQMYHREDSAFPTALEKQWSSEGRYLLLNWKPLMTSNAWRRVANGEVDASTLVPAANRIKAFGKPLFLALWHEPENDVPPKGNAGQPADYIAMWRHVRKVFDQRGVTNVIWTWKTMQYCPLTGLTPQMYPGDAYVDWLAVDTYNATPPTQDNWLTFKQTVDKKCSGTGWPGFYTWALANHPDKPVMVGEYGTKRYPGNDGVTGQWFHDALTTLKTQQTNIKAVIYYDGVGTGGSWRLESSPEGVEALRDIAEDPYLNQPHP
jgi:hypothetical protein